MRHARAGGPEIREGEAPAEPKLIRKCRLCGSLALPGREAAESCAFVGRVGGSGRGSRVFVECRYTSTVEGYNMTAEERAKKSVEAAIKRFEDGRLVVYVEPSDDAPSSILSAGSTVKRNFKPNAEELLDVTNRRVGLEDAPGDFDCFGMEAVMWHLQEMARQAFNEELRTRGVEKPVREQWVRRLTLMKEKN